MKRKSSYKNILFGSTMNGVLAMIAVTGFYIVLGLTGFFTYNYTKADETN